MKFFYYIKYFFYLAINWNIKIAWYIITQEIRGEKKYGITTTGADELHSLEKKGIDIEHSTIYMPVSYDLLEEIFIRIKDRKYHHFLDIGCGKGRALCVAAQHGFATVTGIDLSKELCKQAEENLFVTQQKNKNLQYKIYNNDAFYFEIAAQCRLHFYVQPF